MADVPKRFANHGDDRRLVDSEFSRRLNVQGKSSPRPTKDRRANLAPLLLGGNFDNDDSRFSASRIA